MPYSLYQPPYGYLSEVPFVPILPVVPFYAYLPVSTTL